MFENNNVGNARGVAVFPFNGMDTWNESLGKKFEHAPNSNFNSSLNRVKKKLSNILMLIKPGMYGQFFIKLVRGLLSPT